MHNDSTADLQIWKLKLGIQRSILLDEMAAINDDPLKILRDSNLKICNFNLGGGSYSRWWEERISIIGVLLLVVVLVFVL